jgi:DNA recombination protein RmuC
MDGMNLEQPSAGQALLLLAILSLLMVGLGATVGILWNRSIDRAKQKTLVARNDAERAIWATERAQLNGQVSNFQGQLTSERQAHGLARSDLKRERTTKTELQQKMQPLQAAVTQLGQQQTDAERARQRAQTELKQQVTTMGQQFDEASKGVREEARRLSQALSRSETRGTWGEMQLRRVVESAGMLNHVHFVEQDHVVTEHGTRRPDMVVKLAGGRQIVVDSKVSLDAFLNLSDTDGKQNALQAHADAVSNHVKGLSSKAYWKSYNSPEFVVMFLPAEGLLSAALEAKPSLLQTAFDSNVVIATPTTLLAILRTISYAWQQDQVATQAKQIHAQGIELHNRLATMANHFQSLGTSLAKSVEAFNKTVSSMESRVMPSARRFEKLSDMGDALAEPLEIQQEARSISLKKWSSEMEATHPPNQPDPGLDPQSLDAETGSELDAQDARRSA